MQGELKYKSYLKQFFLNLFFGPLGLFYSSKLLGIVFSITIIPTIGAFGFGLIIGWPISILVGIMSVADYNRNILSYSLRRERIKSKYASGK